MRPMKPVTFPAIVCASLVISTALAGTIPAPKNQPYPGAIRLQVDVTDTDRKIVRVHETVSGIGPDTILLYPQWLPGSHAPEGPIDKLAGITISANGARVRWIRDPVNINAFHVFAPAGVHSVDIDFQYLTPTSAKVGDMEISRDIVTLEWNAVVLYPAGYYSSQIPITASVTVLAGWKIATALEPSAEAATERAAEGAQRVFKTVSLETLIDSPLYAGRHVAEYDLDPGAAAKVRLMLLAERPESLVVTPDQLTAYRTLVQQAYQLFGSHHFSHYDFLNVLSDQIRPTGLEHHQSSEDVLDASAYTEWDKAAVDRDLLPHEFTHSWNGKFRRPADLWTPNFNVPMQNSLLWVYEGQTQYWGQVLAARSGLWTKQQALDEIAQTVAAYQAQSGRNWRALADTANDEIINPRRPISWRDWQRFEDYYDEGKLIWLEVDTLIRERSHEKRSLDDFARAFFGIQNGSFTPVTYVFDDVVRTLNKVEPYDWAAFLKERVESVGKPVSLEGLRRGGYKLVYNDVAGDFLKSGEAFHKRTNLLFSIGAEIEEKDGSLRRVLWDSPAFKAHLIEGTQILAVNGVTYSGDLLKDAIKAAKTTKAPIELIVKVGDYFKVVSLDYHEGLRYPHLERDTSEPARLDDIVAARK